MTVQNQQQENGPGYLLPVAIAAIALIFLVLWLTSDGSDTRVPENVNIVQKSKFNVYNKATLELNNKTWVEYPYEIEYQVITDRKGYDLLVSNFINGKWTKGVKWEVNQSSPFPKEHYSSPRVRYKLLTAKTGKIIVAQNKTY